MNETITSPPPTLDLDSLERLAREATPGPWDRLYDDYGESEPPDMRPGTYFLTNAPSGDQHPIAQAVQSADAAYIAALSPDVVLRLVAAARLGEAWEAAEAALPEGRWVLSLSRPDRVEVTGWSARAFDRNGGYDLKARRRAFDGPASRRAWREVEDSERDYTVYGPSPTAALTALATALSEVKP